VGLFWYTIPMKKLSLTKSGVFIVALMLALGSLFSMGGVFTVEAETVSQKKARLEKELQQLEKEIVKQQYNLEAQQAQTGTLSSEVKKLQNEIYKKKQEISDKNQQIYRLSSDINEKENKIYSLEEELEREKESLSRILRKTNEIEQEPFLNFVFSDGSLSAAVGALGYYSAIGDSLHTSFQRLRALTKQTESEKSELEQKKTQQYDLKIALERDKRTVEQKEGTTKELLQVSKTKEKTYEQILTERKAEAANIRAALFQLRDQDGIPFGEAYDYAKIASQATGVRPAYILAILKQESNMGKNVGTCNRPGDKLTWKDIMPGPTSGSWRDDQSAYLRITKKLGISPDGQPLSCPLASGGWGGAMGPSQFIPVTWESYEDRVAKANNTRIANPWNPQHAITATALYVKDLGADKQTFTAEREAACKYYSGRGCNDPKVKNLFYGNAVMQFTEQIQNDIDVLKSV
jgi:membrane-bound lytic murein transglycosylase B